MSCKSWLLVCAGAALIAGVASGGTFGNVVAIGGEAADLALDEARGVLYIANFTANRIDVMSLATNQVQTSINVPAQPSSIAMSPDEHWLLVANYGNNTAPASPANAMTLIDLTDNYATQTFALGNPPLGVAFGLDSKALVVTTQAFILFDPTVGTTTVLQTIQQVATNAIPQAPQTFPSGFAQASLAVSRDGTTIAGFGGTSPYLLFRYNVVTHGITSAFYTSTPPAGPRVVSLSDDGSLASFAWWLSDANFITSAQFGNVAGLLNVGSSLIDSSRNLVYAQMPVSGTPATANTNSPVLLVLDSDNLTVEEQIQLPENLAGKSVLTSDHNTMYSISDSGVTVLPVGKLSAYPRLAASVEDVVFLGNFCNRNASTQTFTVSDPGGNQTPFALTTTTPGITLSPSSGLTPATISVQVDPNAFANQKGTVSAAITISSGVSIDVPKTVRVLINSEDPSQRGTLIDVPGTVVDLLADPKRNAYYVLRQDKNQVLVFNSTNNTLTATLRTCTTPRGMAITFDQQDLLVGCDNSHYLSIFDLDLLQAQQPVALPSDYVESVASSSNAILAVTRSAADGSYGIDNIDMILHQGTRLPTLGAWENGKLNQDSVMTASSNGANILIAGADGSVMLYDANAGTFTVSRKDFASLGGAYAASSFNQYMAGNVLLDHSGVLSSTISTATGTPSGFAFFDPTQSGYFTTAPSSSAPGVIARVNLSNGTTIQPVAMAEAPILGATQTVTTGTACNSTQTTTSGGTTTVQTCITGTTVTTTTTTCSNTTNSSGTTQSCTTNTTSGPVTSAAPGLFTPSVNTAWTRSLAPLPNESAIVSLSTSGLTVLPWSYAAAASLPQISNVVSAADGQSPVAPGGLLEVLGNNLSPTNLASSTMPLPTALANSCLTVNGQPIPIIFVSPNQINAQMPFQAIGDVTMVVHTPGGVSPSFNTVIQPTAPAVFMSGVAGPETNLPTVIRAQNNLLVTDSNPVHRGDILVIYLTGMGQTNPLVTAGQPSPGDPLASPLTTPSVQLGGQNLSVSFAGLSPGEIGVYQINVSVPSSTPQGLDIPLTISQGNSASSIGLRVVD